MPSYPLHLKINPIDRWLPNRDDVREEDDIANEVDEPEAAESFQGQQNNREKDRCKKEDLCQTVDLQVNKTYLGAWVKGGGVLGHVTWSCLHNNFSVITRCNFVERFILVKIHKSEWHLLNSWLLLPEHVEILYNVIIEAYKHMTLCLLKKQPT